jgi:hypothetical protein
MSAFIYKELDSCLFLLFAEVKKTLYNVQAAIIANNGNVLLSIIRGIIQNGTCLP